MQNWTWSVFDEFVFEKVGCRRWVGAGILFRESLLFEKEENLLFYHFVTNFLDLFLCLNKKCNIKHCFIFRKNYYFRFRSMWLLVTSFLLFSFILLLLILTSIFSLKSFEFEFEFLLNTDLRKHLFQLERSLRPNTVCQSNPLNTF